MDSVTHTVEKVAQFDIITTSVRVGSLLYYLEFAFVILTYHYETTVFYQVRTSNWVDMNFWEALKYGVYKRPTKSVGRITTQESESVFTYVEVSPYYFPLVQMFGHSRDTVPTRGVSSYPYRVLYSVIVQILPYHFAHFRSIRVCYPPLLNKSYPSSPVCLEHYASHWVDIEIEREPELPPLGNLKAVSKVVLICKLVEESPLYFYVPAP